MSRKISIILILLSIIILQGCTSYKFTPGKDTIAYFGNDARYQILSVGTYGLADLQEQKNIESDVYRYYEDKPNVYVVGIQGYTILNYDTSEIKHSIELKDFSDAEVKIFNSERKFRKLEHHGK